MRWPPCSLRNSVVSDGAPLVRRLRRRQRDQRDPHDNQCPRDSVSISIKPTVAPPKHPVKARQTKDGVEGPPPPDSSCHIKVRIGTRFQFSAARQDSYIVEQMFLRDVQAAVASGRLQVFQGETSPSNDLFPEMNPPKTEPAFAIVEYPALARESGLRFVVVESH